MPIYRYGCTKCGAQEEHLQKVSDPPVEVCDACGGPLSKLMTAAAFHLKGGGWYKDLYASSKPGAGSSDSSSGGSDSGGSSSSDEGSSGGSGSSDSGGSKSSESSGSSSSTGSGAGSSSTSAA